MSWSEIAKAQSQKDRFRSLAYSGADALESVIAELEELFISIMRDAGRPPVGAKVDFKHYLFGVAIMVGRAYEVLERDEDEPHRTRAAVVVGRVAARICNCSTIEEVDQLVGWGKGDSE